MLEILIQLTAALLSATASYKLSKRFMPKDWLLGRYFMFCILGSFFIFVYILLTTFAADIFDFEAR